MTCTHLAPAEDMMVVSEMGEQWSPQTAPARHAEMPMNSRGSLTENILQTMGIRIPKVPQEVPVANARNAATTKMIAGRKLARPAAAESIKPPTNTSAPSMPVMFLSAVAKVRIKMAGTIALKGEDIFHPVMVSYDSERPVAIIPGLAIHMDRSARDGWKINRQKT